jgi:D-arabinose 1-dehydrogenase-like Zn-dependent alcohol dehydrogenase
MGCRTVAIARGADKGPLARKLGAHVYLDSTSQDVVAELNRLGGARVILSTVTSAQAMSSVLGGLAINGKMIVVGATPDPVEAPPFLLIGGRRGVLGWPSGTSIESEDTLNFSALADIRPMIETMPLERAAEAYERMMSGDARFRMVITTGQEKRPG